jgi:hypothetical protein
LKHTFNPITRRIVKDGRLYMTSHSFFSLSVLFGPLSNLFLNDTCQNSFWMATICQACTAAKL